MEYDINELEKLFFKSGLYQSSRGWSKGILHNVKEGKNIVLDFLEYAYELAEKEGFINTKLVLNYIWDKAEEFWFK